MSLHPIGRIQRFVRHEQGEHLGYVAHVGAAAYSHALQSRSNFGREADLLARHAKAPLRWTSAFRLEPALGQAAPRDVHVGPCRQGVPQAGGEDALGRIRKQVARSYWPLPWMVHVGPEHRDRRGYFFAAVSLLAGTTAFLPAALPPFGFFAPPLLPGPLSGIVSSCVPP